MSGFLCVTFCLKDEKIAPGGVDNCSPEGAIMLDKTKDALTINILLNVQKVRLNNRTYFVEAKEYSLESDELIMHLK